MEYLLTYLKIFYVQMRADLVYVQRCTVRLSQDACVFSCVSGENNFRSLLFEYLQYSTGFANMHSIIYYMLLDSLHLLCLSSCLWLTYRLIVTEPQDIEKKNPNGAWICWWYSLKFEVRNPKECLMICVSAICCHHSLKLSNKSNTYKHVQVFLQAHVAPKNGQTACASHNNNNQYSCPSTPYHGCFVCSDVWFLFPH